MMTDVRREWSDGGLDFIEGPMGISTRAVAVSVTDPDGRIRRNAVNLGDGVSFDDALAKLKLWAEKVSGK